MADGFSRSLSELLEGSAPGRVVAGYRLEEQVGTGGMAVVFRAIDERLGRRVALKLLAPDLALDAQFRARFTRELRASIAVEHPHIIPVHAAGEADGILYIAMRLVSGGDLRSLIRRTGPVAPERAATIISAIASALDAAHAAGLVHRDVKPANILLDSAHGLPDHVYLSDFGLAKHLVSATSITQPGQFLGTPDYAAPEQITGRAVDGRADQYALAGVAVALLTGRPPYARGSQMSVLWAHVSEPPPALHTVRPQLPPMVDQVIARAMAKAPDGRYPSCGEFAAGLQDALTEGTGERSRAGTVTVTALSPSPGASTPERPARGRPRGRHRSRVGLLMLAGGGLAAALAGLAVTGGLRVHSRPSRPPAPRTRGRPRPVTSPPSRPGPPRPAPRLPGSPTACQAWPTRCCPGRGRRTALPR